MKAVYFLIFVFIFSGFYAQPPTRFYATYGGEGDDVGYSAKVTLDSQYIVAGSTSSFGNNNTDVYLFKVNTMGDAVWHTHHGGIGNDVAKAVIQLPDSGFVLAGYTDSYGAGGFDAYILKTDKLGNLIWQKTWGGTNWEFANDLVLASDGTIMMVGYTQSFGAGKKDGFVVKYDQAGNFISEKFIGGAENEELRSIIKTSDNNLVTVGYTESRGDLNGDMYFLKLNNSGDTIFTRTFGGKFKDFANDVVEKIYNNTYIMCGAKTYSANAKSRSYFMMLTQTGDYFLDSSRYHSIDDEQYVSLANSSLKTNLTGYLKNIPVHAYGFQGNIMVQDHIGFEYAINSFGGGGDEKFFSIESTPDSGYVMVGLTYSYKIGASDVFLIKIAGEIVIKYESIVGIENNTEQEPNEPKFYETNNNTVLIQYESAVNSPYEISLIDISGRILETTFSTTNSIYLDLEKYNCSLFIVKVKSSNGMVWTKKVMRK